MCGQAVPRGPATRGTGMLSTGVLGIERIGLLLGPLPAVGLLEQTLELVGDVLQEVSRREDAHRPAPVVHHRRNPPSRMSRAQVAGPAVSRTVATSLEQTSPMAVVSGSRPSATTRLSRSRSEKMPASRPLSTSRG